MKKFLIALLRELLKILADRKVQSGHCHHIGVEDKCKEVLLETCMSKLQVFNKDVNTYENNKVRQKRQSISNNPNKGINQDTCNKTDKEASSATQHVQQMTEIINNFSETYQKIMKPLQETTNNFKAKYNNVN